VYRSFGRIKARVVHQLAAGQKFADQLAAGYHPNFLASPYAFETQIVEFCQQIAQLAAFDSEKEFLVWCANFWPSFGCVYMFFCSFLTSVSFSFCGHKEFPPLLILMKSFAEKPQKRKNKHFAAQVCEVVTPIEHVDGCS